MAKEMIEAPIPGTVTSVTVKVGAKVNEGDTLLMLESMKMENPILTPVTGTVTEIKVSAGQVVKSGDLLAVVEY
ncbi:MAG: biotin/lipoyl-binding carrier protein [Chloroflexota bacterium]